MCLPSFLTAEQKRTLTGPTVLLAQWFSALLVLQPCHTVPHVVVTGKIVFIAASQL